MASLAGVKSASGTLVAATVDTVTLSVPYNIVTVVNTSSTGVINFTVDGTTPASDGFVAGPNQTVVVTVPLRQQGETAQVNGSSGPTWSLAADGTPVPSAWTAAAGTGASGGKFSRGTDTNNILTQPAATTTTVVKLISAGTPSYSVIGG